MAAEALDVEGLVTEVVGRWSGSLLRTARRHSLCDDDAQDAYQRALELFLRHAERLDRARVHLWLHTVVKHEAMAVRERRTRLLEGGEVDPERHEARTTRSPEEAVLDFEQLERAADALASLKPQELRALWLQAHGLSYREIAGATDWSYTKVNRCLTEGRRALMRRMGQLESGECGFDEALVRVAGGEARVHEVPGLRAHLRRCVACRATLRDRSAALPAAQALLPAAGLPLLGASEQPREAASHLLVRAFEAVAGQVHDRVAHAAVRGQALVDGAIGGGGKAAAVAASAAALAGGGAVAADQVAERRGEARQGRSMRAQAPGTTAATTTVPSLGPTEPGVKLLPAGTPRPPAVVSEAALRSGTRTGAETREGTAARREFARGGSATSSSSGSSSRTAKEFAGGSRRATRGRSGTREFASSAPAAPAPTRIAAPSASPAPSRTATEFGSAGGGSGASAARSEFGG